MSLDKNESNNANEINRSDSLRALELLWQVELPHTFKSLYNSYPQPFLAPCEFYSLDAILAGAGRNFGQVPQFIPFGRAVGEGGLYGFYITQDTARGYFPVLYWDDDEMYLRPVASNFEAFLRNCVLVARFETEEQVADGELNLEDLDEQRAMARLLGIDSQIIFGPLPGNDVELFERLVASDPQDATSLCHLACAARARGDNERALDFLHRAIEAAPWFGDSRYLLADTYRVMGKNARAVEAWWAVCHQLLPLCTRTWEWNLGPNHPEADVYEVAADVIGQYANDVEPEIRATAMWQVVTKTDPYDPDIREEYGVQLLASGDNQAAEREFLNAIYLCSTDKNGSNKKQVGRLYSRLIKMYQKELRSREIALINFDMSLPSS